MKKYFQLFALLFLIICCFIYSEKTVLVVREYDNIMIKIREIESSKKNKPIEAKITDTTIIPGVKGSKVDATKSYLKMKQYGTYDEKLLVYENILPKELLINHKDKYIISGNKSKKMVSLILLIDDKYLDKVPLNLGLNLFFSETLTNYDKYKNLIKGYSKYNDWLSSNFKANHINIKYCFLDKECFKNNLFVIKTEIIQNNYLLSTKKKLENGSIITYKVTASFFDELNLIINYIESKGYKIVDLDTLLKE